MIATITWTPWLSLLWWFCVAVWIFLLIDGVRCVRKERKRRRKNKLDLP